MVEHYLGIDIGYSQRRPTTGLCLLELNQGRLGWECRNIDIDDATRRRDLQGLTRQGTRISAVGIDGPLARNLVQVDYYRAADSILARGLFQHRCKPGPTNSPTGQALNNHAIRLANIVLDLMANGHLNIEEATHPHRIHHSRIAEAFPNAFLGVLLRAEEFANLPPRGQRFDYFWRMAVRDGLLESLVRHLAPQTVFDRPIGDITDHDHRAAFVCALTAMCITRNQYVAVGDPEGGQIILPPHNVWPMPHNVWPIPDGRRTSWAEAELQRNIGEVRRTLLKRPTHGAAFVISNGVSWLC